MCWLQPRFAVGALEFPVTGPVPGSRRLVPWLPRRAAGGGGAAARLRGEVAGDGAGEDGAQQRHRSGRVEIHRRDGERSSPDSGDIPRVTLTGCVNETARCPTPAPRRLMDAWSTGWWSA